MAPSAPLARPVARQLPSDPAAQRRLAAWLGVLVADLPRVFLAPGSQVPLGASVALPAAEAQCEALQEAGLPAEVAVDAAPWARAAGLLLKTGLLAAMVWGVGFSVAAGLEPLLGPGPQGAAVVFGVVLPTALAALVAGAALPAWLILAVLGRKRQGETRREAAQAEAVAAQLAAIGVEGRAAEVDARARALARRVVETRLPASMQSDLLGGIEDCRQALRRGGSTALLAAADLELGRIDEAVSAQLDADALADDVSSPLAALRSASRALRQG